VHPMVLDSDGNGVQQGLGGEVFEHARAMRTLGVASGRTPRGIRTPRGGRPRPPSVG
jgi:hypothetical protein